MYKNLASGSVFVSMIIAFSLYGMESPGGGSDILWDPDMDTTIPEIDVEEWLSEQMVQYKQDSTEQIKRQEEHSSTAAPLFVPWSKEPNISLQIKSSFGSKLVADQQKVAQQMQQMQRTKKRKAARTVFKIPNAPAPKQSKNQQQERQFSFNPFEDPEDPGFYARLLKLTRVPDFTLLVEESSPTAPPIQKHRPS